MSLDIREDVKMSMRISSSNFSRNAYRHLNETQGKLSRSIERLSSGFRINRSADDAAGLAISEKLRAQISGYEVAVGNAQDGISIIQTADGALDRTHTILRRIRDITELAANGDKTDTDRNHYQGEVSQLLEEIDRIGNTTEYNNRKLLDGSAGSQVREIGDRNGINVASAVKVVNTPEMDGEYRIEVRQQADKATAMFTAGHDNVDISTESTFSHFMGNLGVNDGTYSFRISMDSKDATVDLVAKAGAGDTVSEVINKINDALENAGMEAQARFVSDVDSTGALLAAVEIQSDNFGSAHDISISVVNQPGNVYSDANYNAVEGTAGAIYNSDLSNAEGNIDGSRVFFAADVNNDLQAFMPPGVVLLKFTDRTDASANLLIKSGDTIDDIVSNINLMGLQISASFNENAGAFELTATGSGKDYFEIRGLLDNDNEKKTAAMLGLYGRHYGGTLTGARLSGTKDYHLQITAPEQSSTVDVFARFGNRSTLFNAVESSAAVTESQMEPVLSGSEKTRTGGISGIEFRLEEKNMTSGDKFSILVKGNELQLQVGVNDSDESRVGVSISRVSTENLRIKNINVSTQANARSVLDSGVIDSAIETISSTRAKLSAAQNQLNQRISNLSVVRENLSAAESRIRDTDFAMETMEFTKNQILNRSGTIMLQQSNLTPNLVLSLLV